MKGIFTETVIEFLDRKQHWLLLLVTAIAAVVIYFAVKDKLDMVRSEITSQASLVQSASNSLSNSLTVVVLLSVLSTVFFIPRISRKGRVEFYLSKPITRQQLFLGKVISLWVIYSFMVLFCGTLVAVELSVLNALSLRSAFYILIMGAAAFTVWFSVTSFIGFWSKSVSISISTFAVVWLAQLLLKNRTSWTMEQRIFQYVLDTVYFILPKTSEMSGISVQLATGTAVSNFLPVFTSLFLAGVLIYSSMSVFIRRDF